MEFFKLNPDLAKAETLPAHFYRDAGVWEEEKRKLFNNTWQYVTSRDRLQKPGDFVAAQVIDEPLLLVGQENGGVRAMSNVCRHRGSLLLDGQGNAAKIRCPYHAWTYQTDGQLIGQPEFQGVENWDRSKVCLPKFPLEAWGPFLFTHLGTPAFSLNSILEKIPGEVAAAGIDLNRFKFLHRKDYLADCNWKAYIDNYLEGYHIPHIHPALFDELDYNEYRVELFEYYSSQISPLKAAGPANRRYDPNSGQNQALYYWLFPNLTVNIYPDNINLNLVIPVGPEKTLIVFEWFVRDDLYPKSEAEKTKIVEFSDNVQKEDVAICERVQIGLRSKTYSSGRYSVKRENGVHHFHQLWEKFLHS